MDTNKTTTAEQLAKVKKELELAIANEKLKDAYKPIFDLAEHGLYDDDGEIKNLVDITPVELAAMRQTLVEIKKVNTFPIPRVLDRAIKRVEDTIEAKLGDF